MTQSRWQSKILWTTMISLVILLGTNYGLWDMIGMTSEVFQQAANLVLTVFVALGLVNNPTSCDSL